MSRIGQTSTRHPLCPNCGYDLVATVDAGGTVCPECGYAFELHELGREVRPDDWTLARGLRRLALALGVRVVACFIGFTAILWAADALINALGPKVPMGMKVMLIFVAAVTIFTAGGGVGHILARDAEERAGFVSPLLAVVITLVGWVVIIFSVVTVQMLGGLAGGTSAGVILVSAGFSFIAVIRALYFGE